MKSTQPADQKVRDRFVTELERNFSVIAPAGVGKTKAVVDRVIAMATGDFDRVRAWLPRLVVVTYTNKAADEMHQRARNEIISRGADLSVLGQFNRAFFGTIHSFCLRLLRQHGHHLGLPARLEMPEDGDRLWLEFTRQLATIPSSLPETIRKACFRYCTIRDVIALGRWARPALAAPEEIGLPPETDVTPLIAFEGGSRKSVEGAAALLRRWQAAREAGEPFVGLPECKKGGKEFLALWKVTFAPLRRWVADCSWAIARDIAVAFQAYRLGRGLLTYDDQVELAAELLRHREAGALLREEGYRIILDEAQDTDPHQFDVLLELARPTRAQGVWLREAKDPPEPGRFCMVGDPQQSIYSDRANLAHYEKVRALLEETGAAEELVFEVTFRCDEAIVGAVNALAPAMLTGKDGQAAFVPLKSRPAAGPGQVAVLGLERPADLPAKPKVAETAALEAGFLARWLKEQGLEKLRAASWSQVAILCPRKRWFAPFERALRAVGLETQIHSPKDLRGGQPACAWFTALMVVAAEPRHAFELVGVLREIFGLSDQQLADFAERDGSRFQIETANDFTGPVAETLNLLAAARARAAALPLRDAARHLVEASLLRARLRSIADEPEDAEEELDALLVRAAEAEVKSQSAADWAAELRRDLEEEIEAKHVQPDAVQLITCQKAKGLQWDAVILPLLARDIGYQPDYPLVIASTPGQPPRVAFGPEDIDDLKSTLKLRKQHELERILYVSLTRARRTLVLLDDRPVTKPSKSCFAELLRIGAEGRGAWEGLDSRLTAVTGPATKASAPAAGQELPPLDARQKDRAAQRAGEFARRILPSSLARHTLPEEPERALGMAAESAEAEEPALDYGTWWHGVMECLDWPAGPAAWKKVFRDRFPDCPMPARAEREWKLFVESDLAKRLRDPDLVLHPEMPFLWRRSDKECLEGFVDLAVLDPSKGEWLVIDWKTNQDTKDLRQIYAGQIGAYLEALRGVTGLGATGGLYATATGEWIPCS